MRYAIVSDIHANAQAWVAVRHDIVRERVDRIISLGDVVGYGPDPVGVLKSVCETVDIFVLGNHDAALAGRMGDGLFNDDARRILHWTRARLGPRRIKPLSAWPLTVKGEGFRCAHGDFEHPSRFYYVTEPQEAMHSWATVPEPLLFVGHSHCPALFVLGPSGTPHQVGVQDFALEPGKRFIVNVGSVGQPRDGDPRASYAIYDTESQAVFFRRVPFDTNAYRRAVEAAKLPSAAMAFLADAAEPPSGVPMEETAFRPAKDDSQAAQGAAAVQELGRLKKNVRRLKRTVVALAILSAVLAGAGGWVFLRYATRAAEIVPAEFGVLDASGLAPGENLATLPVGPVPAGRPVEGWGIRLGDRKRQSVSVAADPGDSASLLRMSSSVEAVPLAVSSREVTAAPDQKFAFEALFRKSPDFRGSVAADIVLVRRKEDGSEYIERHRSKEPGQPRKDGWGAVRVTVDLPSNVRRLLVRIAGDFTGEVDVRDIQLVRKVE